METADHSYADRRTGHPIERRAPSCARVRRRQRSFDPRGSHPQPPALAPELYTGPPDDESFQPANELHRAQEECPAVSGSLIRSIRSADGESISFSVYGE